MDFRDLEKREGIPSPTRARAGVLSTISIISTNDPSQWPFIEKTNSYLETLDLPRWHTRPRITRLLLSILAIAAFLIPPKIWQIYLSFSREAIAGYSMYIHSFISHSPSHTYTLLDSQGALSIISRLSESKTHAHILPLFYAMSRRVMRADFLRYLLLAIEGGVYSDMDTEMVKPLWEWVPDAYKSRTKLIVGLEADQNPPVPGTTYPVQFCQWTLASAPGHPAMWTMVERILDEVKKRPYEIPMKDVDYSDKEVLDITGPAGWTEVVFEYLSLAAGEEVSWRNLTGMRSPRLFGDVLVLPIDAFASGVPHSGASAGGEGGALVRHQFQGSWKGGDR
ncbi:uncharacterized protein PAC_15697 [Phialocephala subalpina]|uniref:Initiation-specific alpha-1,6-mannosyltransferase n=1 Tax=Phialocephala subalpina TaxID=576137 RepID=A0A1L7XLH9_9HELO|nr:uncharacterized protein PAC_15697 [Phialocephala subalpina]